MKIRYFKYYNIFFIALIALAWVIAAGIPLQAHAQSKDDVQSTAVPGQIAPRLQNLGNHKFPVSTDSARAQLQSR